MSDHYVGFSVFDANELIWLKSLTHLMHNAKEDILKMFYLFCSFES